MHILSFRTEERLRNAKLNTFWYCFATNQVWQKMMLDKIQAFEANGGRVLHMVENIGTQLTMAYEDPKNLAKRKTVLGPNLFFNSDGSIDPVPLHYLDPSLPNNPKSKPTLRVLNSAVDETKSLRKLIMTHMPGQLRNHVGTAGKPSTE